LEALLIFGVFLVRESKAGFQQVRNALILRRMRAIAAQFRMVSPVETMRGAAPLPAGGFGPR